MLKSNNPHGQTSEWSRVLAILLVAVNLRPALAALGPVLESVRSDLQLSHGVAGLLTALPVICMGVFAPLAMSFSARLGLKRTVTAMMCLLTLGTLLRAQPSLISLLLGSVLLGLALAVLAPILGAYIKQDFPLRTGRLSAWMTTAICLGAAVPAASTALLSQHLGWSLALASWSVLALVGIAGWLIAIPTTLHAPQLFKHTLPWTTPRAWLLVVIFGLHSTVFYCLLTWLAPTYLHFGLSAAEAGHVLGAFTLIQVVAPLLIGWLAGAPGAQDRRPALVVSALCLLLGLLALWLTPLSVPYLSVMLLGAGGSGLFALSMILPMDYGASPSAVTSWTAMMCGGGYIISAMGPYLSGLLLDLTGSYTTLLGAMCLVIVVLIPLCMMLTPVPAARAD